MLRTAVVTTIALFCMAGAWAAEPPAAPAPAPAPAAATAPDKQVIEDDNVRIEETRVRGQLSRITVQTKLGGRLGPNSYEIIVGPGGRDPSQKNAQGASGQRAWSVLSF